jgi:hypothetical protein
MQVSKFNNFKDFCRNLKRGNCKLELSIEVVRTQFYLIFCQDFLFTHEHSRQFLSHNAHLLINVLCNVKNIHILIVKPFLILSL